MYSRYGLYFRFTALQTVCKYDQLNPGKKKVLSFTLREKTIQKWILGTNFHLFKFTVKTQPLILNFFYLHLHLCAHGLLQKMVEKFIRITVQLFLSDEHRSRMCRSDVFIPPISHQKNAGFLIVQSVTYWLGAFVSGSSLESLSSQTPASL